MPNFLDYATMWIKKHGIDHPEENEMDSAVTQQIRYPRQKFQEKK